DRARVALPPAHVEARTERRLELMAPVRRLERLALEAVAVRGGAHHDGIQTSVLCGDVRPERLVVVPEAEVTGRRERLVSLGPPCEHRLELRVGAQRRVDLHA